MLARLVLNSSSDPSVSASQSAGVAGVSHCAPLFGVFLEMRFHHVAQAGLEFLGSSDPPTSASQIAGFTHVSHQAWPSPHS